MQQFFRFKVDFLWIQLRHHANHLLVQHLHVIWICRSKFTKLELALRSIRKVSSLCPNPFKGFTLRSESVEGLKGVGDQTTVSWSALLRHYTDVPSSCKESAQRIMGPEVSISCTLWNPSFRRALRSGKFLTLRLGTTLQYGGHDFFHSEVPFGGQYIRFWMHRKNAIKLAWACVSFLPHSHVNEWKLMDWKV